MIMESYCSESSEIDSKETETDFDRMARKTEITFEEGWSFLQKGITKLIKNLEEEPEPSFGSQQYVELYTTVYIMCSQKLDYSSQLYDKYREVIEAYTIQKVLPSLREKHDEYMLRELVKRWNNHKVMIRYLSRFLLYVDRHFVARRGVPSLQEVGLTCFHDLVYREVQSTAKDALIVLIHKEREGEQIDRELVKSVVDVYVENGMGTMGKYEEDFERFMLQDTASYYSSKASKWILEDSCPDYMLKSEECLERERKRVTHYLHSSTEPKLIEEVQNALFVVVGKQLLENEQSGFRALLRDDKRDEFSRIYRVYQTIPQGLKPVADLFKQHITEERNDLIKQADDTATNQVVMELRDKYMVYVNECFDNHILFHKALEEAFEILRRDGGSEKLE